MAQKVISIDQAHISTDDSTGAQLMELTGTVSGTVSINQTGTANDVDVASIAAGDKHKCRCKQYPHSQSPGILCQTGFGESFISGQNRRGSKCR